MKKLIKNESQRAVSIDLIEDVCWKNIAIQIWKYIGKPTIRSVILKKLKRKKIEEYNRFI